MNRVDLQVFYLRGEKRKGRKRKNPFYTVTLVNDRSINCIVRPKLLLPDTL